MRKLLILSFVFFSSQIRAQILEEEQYNKEPQDLFEINVNGKTFQVVQGKVLKIDSLLRPQIHIMQLPEKKFENGFCSFLYNRRMNFDYESDGHVQTWTLGGPNVFIMLFDLPMSANLTDISKVVVSRFNGGSCKVSDTTLKVGNRVLTGKFIDIEMAEQKLRQEYYAVEFNKGGGGYILIQDVMHGDWHSGEYTRAMNLLLTSLVFKAKVKQ